MNYNQDAERIRKAEDSLRTQPYNLEAWSVLIRFAQNQDVKKARRIYESLIKHFPTSGRWWRIYIEHEISSRNWDHVERLFQRCLNNVLNVDLWKTYLQYIREQKSAQIRAEGNRNGDPVHRVRQQIVDAYEFALSKVGLDINSFSIWNDYIAYLQKAPPPQSAIEIANAPGGQGNDYAEGQKIVKIRKVFQRAVVTPILNLESIWRDYTQWEQTINATIARKMLEDRQRDFQVAKRVARELDQLSRGLNRNAPALPPSGGSSTDERRQVDMWRKIIEWEKCNNCKSPDPSMVIKRTIFTYEQCLQCMAHHAPIWYEAAGYMMRSAELYREKNAADAKLLDEQTKKLMTRAIADDSPVRASFLLHFKYAEFEEKQRDYDSANKIYERLYQKGVGGGSVISEQDQKLLGIDTEGVVRVDDPLATLTPVPIKDPSLAYIQHMRFARRVEGIKAARAVFKRARLDERISYHVYVFAALMEYNCTKDTAVSQKIFELGLKRFKNDVEFLQQYTKFMQTLNESNNTRVLYERVLADEIVETEGRQPLAPKLFAVSNIKNQFLWSDYLKFESMIGDLASIENVEERKITNTISSDSVTSTNPFNLADQIKQTMSHVTGLVNRQERNFREKDIDMRYDNVHIRSDIIQRNKTNVQIDRYRFIDLEACNDGELRSQGIDFKALAEMNQELINQDEANAAKQQITEAKEDAKSKKKDKKRDGEKSAAWRLGRRPMADQAHPDLKRKYTDNEAFVRPTFRQMTPFKPEHHPWPTRIGTKGGNFPPPPSAAALMRIMPPPRCFLGPFVIIDQLLEKVRNTKLPEKKEYVSAVKSGDFEKLLVKKEEAKPGDITDLTNGEPSNGHVLENGDTGGDLFKIRQMKRSKQTAN